ncbi:type IV secretion system protein [Buttiauxella ferragutiae]|uniref:type IV secretion system protein n=1 Tax=Buttiauxella ferragutiae TaxID=82989 RepID=UPI001F536F83|nr:type IV secretion system protein [Buttiauxella ferragutiae]UNK63135.1 type IV secretion system protein [Buttiauxella ferragutiae]
MSGSMVGMHTFIMSSINTVLVGQSSTYGNMISVIATSSFTAYIIFRGYQTLAGKLIRPAEDVMWDTGRMLLIMMFVLNLGGWLDTVISALDGFKDGVSGSDNIWVLLDSVWEKAQKLAKKLYEMDDSTVPLEGMTAEFLVWAGAIIVLAVSTLVNLLAEITILLMGTTAPLFIFCLAYGFLRSMFSSWLSVILNALLTILFSALFLRIGIKYMTIILDTALAVSQDKNMVTLAIQSLLACFASALIIWFSAKIASALTGAAVQATMQGAAMAGIGSMGSGTKPMSDAVSGSLGKMGDRAAKNLNAGSSSPSAARKSSIQTMQRSNQQRK